MRSKSEIIIANELDNENIAYKYEERLPGIDGDYRYPDFTIEDSINGKKYYWEHLGMLNDPEYSRAWKKKLAWYRRQHILPCKDGKGENNVLIISEDDEMGGIDSAKIRELIQEILL